MAVLLVAYDLNKEEKRPRILEEIKKDAWAKLSESSYAIDTYDSPDDVYNRLKEFIDQNDQLYIIGLHRPWQGFGPKDVNEWLNDRLKHC